MKQILLTGLNNAEPVDIPGEYSGGICVKATSVAEKESDAVTEILPLKYGESVLPENMIFINGSSSAVRKIVFKIYLIKMGSRLLLVDAGCETMPGFDMKNFIGPIKALENIGVFPDDITDVILTHSHHDHIECVKYFGNATVHIEFGEYENGRRYIPDGFKLNIFKDEFDVCQNIKIRKIGGHSRGSCIVEAKVGGRIFVVAGDECYLRECLLKKIPTGSSFSPVKSREFIEKYSEERYTVLLCHDD